MMTASAGNRIFRTAIFSVLLSASAPTQLLADAPKPIDSAIFAASPDMTRMVLSEDGSQLAYVTTENKKSVIMVQPAQSDAKAKLRVPVGEYGEVNWLRWVGNHVLFSMSQIYEYGGEEYRRSTLALFDVAKKQVRPLTLPTQSFVGDDIIYSDPAGKYILLDVARDVFRFPGVYQFELATGRFALIQEPSEEISEWIADNRGVVRGGVAYGAKTAKLYYRRDGKGALREIARIDNSDERDFRVVGIAAGSDSGYVISDHEQDMAALYRYDFASGTFGERVHAVDGAPIGEGIIHRDTGELKGLIYTDAQDRVRWLDPALAAQQARLEKALPGQWIWLDGVDRKPGERTLVFTGSPADPGNWFVFDPASKKLDRLGGINDAIDPKRMTTAEYISYPARDGQTIHAYLTLPRDRPAANLPLVIMPHGGPYGIRDSAGFDAEVQYLANRGYVVIQPNFRGSGGYGRKFYEAGAGQIGRKMQDDLDDAMDWLVKRGTVDKARVCVVGTSYGGYAALWSVIRDPDRYRCAASYAGVTNFTTQLRYTLNYLSKREGQRFRRQVEGDGGFDLGSISPASNMSRLTRPVLVVHGTKDSRVPFSQYKSFVGKADKSKGLVEAHSYPGEIHGFENPDNRKDWFDRLGAFLAKHNPA